MSETREARLKRMHMRSWRRGIKEMDLIFGGWADEMLEKMSEDELVQYDALLSENDQDLYAWITGAHEMPEDVKPLLEVIARHAGAR